MHITDAQLATYKEQGFLIVENFLTKDEQQAALDGFFTHFAPPYDQYLANDHRNDTPQQRLFPWDHSGLNHVTVHPDLIDAAERVLGTREIRLCEGHLGMKYAGEEYGTNFHIDYGNNTLGPIIEPDDFMNLVCFYCFDDVEEGMAPIRMVPKGHSDAEAVPMIVPGGSVCLYSVFTRHAASDFTAPAGHRPVMWVGFTRKDRPWDGGRTFTYKSGAQGAAMNRFMAEATPRQRELLGFPPPGDALWTEEFIAGMATRYPGFDPTSYRTARNDDAGTLDPRYVNRRVVLPYGLKVEEIEQAVAETYRLFHGLNDFLESSGFRPLEELLLGNSLSGMISEFLVKNIARVAETLEANAKVGGHPDLLPKGHYASNLVLKGDEGIEIKSSIQRGGWQGHNPEDCWLMVFRYAIGEQEKETSTPLTFLEILCAKLDEADWSFSGRTETSRRTPTASITKTGVEKLRNNFLYRLPDVGIGRHRAILAEP